MAPAPTSVPAPAPAPPPCDAAPAAAKPPGPACSPPPAAAAATVATNPNQPPGLTPAIHQPQPLAPKCAEPQRQVKAPRYVKSSQVRPGARLQECLLRNLYDTVIPGAISSSSPPTFIWISPASRSPHYNIFFVRNAVHYLLVAPPDRLLVRRVRDCVFHVRVSSQNVANVLVILGSLRLGSSVLLLHPSMAAAERHARSLPPWENGAVIAHPSAVTSTQLSANAHASAYDHSLRWARGNPALIANARCPRIVRDTPAVFAQCSTMNGTAGTLSLTLGANATDHPARRPPGTGSSGTLSPTPGTNACLIPNGPAQVPSSQLLDEPAAFTTPLPARPKTYLQAALSPAAPKPTSSKILQPFTHTNGCFRCLGTDHKVRDCREPARCRNCRGWGHRLRDCKMPIARVLTPFLCRRAPTIPTPANVHAVPYAARTTRPRSNPPPPPPNSHIHLLTNAAFHPYNMIQSSSNSAPDFEARNAAQLVPGSSSNRPVSTPPTLDIHLVDPRGKGLAVLPASPSADHPARVTDRRCQKPPRFSSCLHLPTPHPR